MAGYPEEIMIGEVNTYFIFEDGDFKVHFFAFVKNLICNEMVVVV